MGRKLARREEKPGVGSTHRDRFPAVQRVGLLKPGRKQLGVESGDVSGV